MLNGLIPFIKFKEMKLVLKYWILGRPVQAETSPSEDFPDGL